MAKEIIITNQNDGTVNIDIEGVIGVPEKWQFEEPGQRVATYEAFRAANEAIKELDVKNIVVNIRSTGGDVNDALLIYDALKGLEANITTRCFGYVASAATIIAQAASPGYREISGNSLYLIHRSVCSTGGNSQELEKTLDMLGKTDQRIAAVYATRSGKNASEFATLMGENNGNGRWLSPEETIGFGLADKIIEASPIKADAKEMVKNLGLPPIPKKRRNIVAELVKKWDSILETIGVAQNNVGDDASAVIDETAPETRNPEALPQNTETDRVNNMAETLEAQNARLAAHPTTTKPKEDPSPQEMRFSKNENAYLEDLRKFI